MQRSKTIGTNSSGNRRRRIRSTLLTVVFLASVPMARALYAGDKNLSLLLRGTYTTSSRIFVNPDATTEEQLTPFSQLHGITGGGMELRYRWPGENFFFSLSSDVLSVSHDRNQFFSFSPTRRLPVTEGLRLIPVEFGMHSYIPIGSETMRVSMGGGIGIYFGERILRVAGVEAAMQNNPVRFGIHVSSGVEYRLLSDVWIRGEMKFRDPEFHVVSRFTQERMQFEGTTITFPQNDFSSRVNVNGMAFAFGVAVELL